MTNLLWLRRIGASTLACAALLALSTGCDRTSTSDASSDGGRDAEDVDDTGGYPPFDCVQDDSHNMQQCMLDLPDSGPETDWGTWCDGDCRPTCNPPTECPAPLVCKRHGVTYLCFPE